LKAQELLAPNLRILGVRFQVSGERNKKAETRTLKPDPFLILNIETGDPPAGWGVRRTISNPPPAETAEVFEKNKTMFFTSIFCGSLFCCSAVHLLKATGHFS
jgi:hypothetical protein